MTVENGYQKKKAKITINNENDTITVSLCSSKTSIYLLSLIFTEHSIGSLSNFGIMYSSYVIALIMKKRVHVCLYVSLRVCNFVLNLILMTSGYIS